MVDVVAVVGVSVVLVVATVFCSVAVAGIVVVLPSVAAGVVATGTVVAVVVVVAGVVVAAVGVAEDEEGEDDVAGVVAVLSRSTRKRRIEHSYSVLVWCVLSPLPPSSSLSSLLTLIPHSTVLYQCLLPCFEISSTVSVHVIRALVCYNLRGSSRTGKERSEDKHKEKQRRRRRKK